MYKTITFNRMDKKDKIDSVVLHDKGYTVRYKDGSEMFLDMRYFSLCLESFDTKKSGERFYI